MKTKTNCACCSAPIQPPKRKYCSTKCADRYLQGAKYRATTKLIDKFWVTYQDFLKEELGE